jgi:hypothetical protein
MPYWYKTPDADGLSFVSPALNQVLGLNPSTLAFKRRFGIPDEIEITPTTVEISQIRGEGTQLAEIYFSSHTDIVIKYEMQGQEYTAKMQIKPRYIAPGEELPKIAGFSYTSLENQNALREQAKFGITYWDITFENPHPPDGLKESPMELHLRELSRLIRVFSHDKRILSLADDLLVQAEKLHDQQDAARKLADEIRSFMLENDL